MARKHDAVKAQVWSERIAAFEESGLSRGAWCRDQGLNANTLDYWRSRLRTSARSAALPIVVKDGSAANGPDIEVRLPSGVAVRARSGTDAQWLASVLRALTC